MRKKPIRNTTILGVSLGTRSSGVAVINHRELLHWQTHSFPEIWSKEKAETILSRIVPHITRHKVETVVIKIPPVTHQTDALMAILKRLLSSIQYHGCMVQVTTKREIKALVPEVTNKGTLLRYVTDLYPSVVPEAEQESNRKEPYHLRMFEAILTAHLYKQKE